MTPKFERLLKRMEFCFGDEKKLLLDAMRWVFHGINIQDQWKYSSETRRISFQWDVPQQGKVTVCYELSSRTHVYVHRGGGGQQMWVTELDAEDLIEMKTWLVADKLATLGERAAGAEEGL